MEPEVQKQRTGIRTKNTVIISLLTFILLMLAITGQFAYAILNYDGIYNGVRINGLNMGSFTREKALSFLADHYRGSLDNLEIKLKTDDQSHTFRFSEVDAAYDMEKAVEDAYRIGREGSIFKRFYEILLAAKDSVQVDLPIIFNRQKAESIVQDFYNRTLVNVREAVFLIQNEKVTAKSGRHGRNIDKNRVLSDVEQSLYACANAVIDISYIITPPSKINVDDIYMQINCEAKDAYAIVESNEAVIVPHVVGRSIEKSVLASIAEKLEKNEDTEMVVPVVCKMPDILTEDAKGMLFRDVLSTVSTAFTTNDQNGKNRAENIKISVSKIDNKVLAPGEVFSFNDIVGPRDEAGGYKSAQTYVQGKVVDGIGGGICQVSSTLYNAALLSDLEIVERRNHMFTVGYVDKGRDATVSYNEVDFKFRNSTKWPLKIKAEVKNNRVYFTLVGTNENPGKTVEIQPTILKTTDFQTVYKDDPNLEEGKTVVKQPGKTGYVVDTYKIIKQDGKVVSQTKLHTSVYRPLDQEVLRGTKKTAAAPEQQAPVPHISGVDDADNPPADEAAEAEE